MSPDQLVSLISAMNLNILGYCKLRCWAATALGSVIAEVEAGGKVTEINIKEFPETDI